METQHNNPSPSNLSTDSSRQETKRPRPDRALAGLIVVAVGGALLAHQLGVHLPYWMFSWQVLLIVIGFYIGARHSFKNPGWLIPVAIGVVFLMDNFFLYDINLAKFLWPVLIIIFGLVMIFKTRKRNDRFSYGREGARSETFESSENFIESVTIFGGTKKNIISKDFKGGEAVTVFGGTELNLMQADTENQIVLELTQIFGGTKLIIPPHWKIQTVEMVTIFGGLDDKRPLPSHALSDQSKVLIL